MARILVPIDFSDTSAHALHYAYNIAQDKGMKLTLLHCYSEYVYNRRFDFKEIDYGKGIQNMLIDFYKKHTAGEGEETRFLARAGSLAEKVILISLSYKLIVISGHDLNSASTKFLGSRSLTIVSEAKCPVVIVPVSASYQAWKKVWHIRRRDNESDIVAHCLDMVQILPSAVQIKTFQQTTFISPFWKYIVQFTKKPSSKAEQTIAEHVGPEKVDLMILVSHQKETFQKFVNEETSKILFHFEIPVMVCQAK